MRGSLYSEADLTGAEELGFELIRGVELRSLGPRAYAQRVRERVGEGPAFLSFDVDFVDPAFDPATGTPEPGGPSSAEALELVRALTEIGFVGFDVMEVSPPYDPPGQPTALLGRERRLRDARAGCARALRGVAEELMRGRASARPV